MLENSTVTRVGGDKEIKLDVRVVCATHKDLTAMAEKRIFRVRSIIPPKCIPDRSP